MAAAFHLAFPVRDLASTRAFYGEVLGCRMGRSAPTWQDFDFFGHQLTAHVTPGTAGREGRVDGQAVPIPHFGAVLDFDAWQALTERLREADVDFVEPPHVRFAGQAGEQGTCFLCDPSGNVLEFKGFRDAAGIFPSQASPDSVA